MNDCRCQRGHGAAHLRTDAKVMMKAVPQARHGQAGYISPASELRRKRSTHWNFALPLAAPRS